MSKSSGAHQDFKQDSVKQPPTGKPLPPRSSLSKQVTLEEQSGPTCVPQVQDQLAVGKPDNLEPGGRRMADSPQPPWKFWLRVGSAAVGVGVEKLDEITRDLSWTEGSVELSELVSSSDSSWYIGTLALTLVKNAIFSRKLWTSNSPLRVLLFRSL